MSIEIVKFTDTFYMTADVKYIMLREKGSSGSWMLLVFDELANSYAIVDKDMYRNDIMERANLRIPYEHLPEEY